MKRTRSKRHSTAASQPEHRIVNGLRRVFGLYPTTGGDVFGFYEADEEIYQHAKARAGESGLSVGEMLADAMRRRGVTLANTGRCGLPQEGGTRP